MEKIPKIWNRIKKNTTILFLLPLLSRYLNTCEDITTYNCDHITKEVIMTYDNMQVILTHLGQKRYLSTISVSIYTLRSRIGEMKK